MPIHKLVNTEFFTTWSPEMAYVLGFIIADGTVTHTKRDTYFLSIQITDLLLLKAIQHAMGSNHTIHVRERHGNERTIYRLQVGSKIICNDLAHFGVVPQKAHVTNMPSVPDEFLGDFVRGYFDGDGNVWVGIVHKERRTKLAVIQTAFTSCSRDFLESLKEALKQKGINGSIACRESYFRLSYSVRSSLALYALMYAGDSPLQLPRKRLVFERFLRERERTANMRV